MAVLSDADRREIHAELMRRWSDDGFPTDLLKLEVRDLIDRVVGWIEANKISFNNSLSAKQKNGLTAREKARAFMLVASTKFKVEV